MIKPFSLKRKEEIRRDLTIIEFQCLQHKQQYSRTRGISLIQKRVRDSFKWFLTDFWWTFPKNKRISAKKVYDIWKWNAPCRRIESKLVVGLKILPYQAEPEIKGLRQVVAYKNKTMFTHSLPENEWIRAVLFAVCGVIGVWDRGLGGLQPPNVEKFFKNQL